MIKDGGQIFGLEDWQKSGLNEQKCDSICKKGDEKFDLGYAELVTEKTKWRSSAIKAQVRGGQNFKNERDGW